MPKTAPEASLPPALWPADAVERRPVAALIPYARNSRTHSPAQVAQIAASIREWGWTVPILIDEAGTIIAGHGRVMAAQRLGVTEVPVMIARGWSEAKRRAYVVADNRLAENAGWNVDMLLQELGDIASDGYDLAGLIGFSEADMARLLGEMAGDTDMDAEGDGASDINPLSSPGDVWLLGAHRLSVGQDPATADAAIRAWEAVGGQKARREGAQPKGTN